MQVAKWGNSLAIRIPKDVVAALGLKAGDDIDFQALDGRSLQLTRRMTREEAIEDLKRFEGWMPADFKFDREEANER